MCSPIICNKLCYIYAMALFFFIKKHLALCGTPISIYFSNNYFTVVTMQDYFGILYVCACVRACICIYIYIYIYIYAGNESPGSAKSYTNIFIIMELMAFYLNVCVCVRACVRACMRAYVYIYIYIYIYIYMQGMKVQALPKVIQISS